jgi:2-methylcitrate dehydratase PrpD
MHMNPSVSERLVSFMQTQAARDLPETVLHEAKRLVLNQLKASVRAADHDAVRILHDWAIENAGAQRGARVLWLGTDTGPAQAAMVNGALFEVLDFHDTYIPTFMHAVSAVLPAVLAAAEQRGSSGQQLLDALAIGLEVELAIATMLMPTGYYRGFVPAGLVGGVGAAAACSVLADLDATRARNALGLAMCTAFGLYESVGSMGLPYITGATARSGLSAFELAERGFDAPRTAFDGERGMFICHADEKPEKIESVLASLGETWRIFGQSYKTVPTETITHAPIECVLALLPRARGRNVRRMRFGVQPIVVKIADERRERFGRVMTSELQARFDTRFCAAAAWIRGRFTLDETREPAYTDEAILALRDRTDLIGDDSLGTFEGCSLEIEFEDGSIERTHVDAFLGTPGNPMSDAQLSAVFRDTAAPVLIGEASERILDAVWQLDTADDVRAFTALTDLRASGISPKTRA